MSLKIKTIYICQQCGAQHSKWLGRCTECGKWDSLVEETTAANHKHSKQKAPGVKPIPLSEIPLKSEHRVCTGISEFDRILGGGIVAGSLTLVGGEPGVGKSTLLLQIAGSYAEQKHKVLYVSGEESGSQIKLRAERLGINKLDILLLSEINLYEIESNIRSIKPDLVIVDSIQTIQHPDFGSAPGSVGQVRENAARFQMLAKGIGVPIFLVGHVTKDGAIAGPRVLEHIVDTVLYFEGDTQHTYRLLRTVKNRFGASNEVAVFAMHEKGLEQVSNPSEVFLSGRMKGVCGAVAVCVREGTRPILIELQALVGHAHYGTPQRVTSGVDQRRLSLLLAVIEKSERMPLGPNDVFLNVVGGLRVEETALDLGVICAVASSFLNIPIDDKVAIVGEVGLGGEIRPVSNIEARLKEISRLGFHECLIPAKFVPKEKSFSGLNLTPIKTVHQAVQWIRNKKKEESTPLFVDSSSSNRNV